MNKFKSVLINAALTTLFCASASSFATQITVMGARADNTTIPFSATGPMVLSKAGIDLACTAVFAGNVTTTGDVQITSVAFNGNAMCGGIKATASPSAPWTGHADTPTQITLNNVGVKTPRGEQCGPSAATATINDNGTESVISFHHSAITGGCVVSGALVTTPYLHMPH